MNGTLSFKDATIVTLALLTIYLSSPHFREFYETFKKDVSEFDNGIPEIDMEEIDKNEYGPYLEERYPKDNEESNFSDISQSHLEDLNRFRKIFSWL